MVWLEDPLTGDVPHRGIVEEEDEEQAQELAPQYAAVPAVQWAPGQAVVTEAAVVVLAGQAACLLSGAVLRQAQAVGSISVPELVRVRSPLEEEFGTGQQPVHACTLHTLGSSGGSGSGLLLVQCPRELPAEQAPVWARTVLAALQPRALVVAATLPAMSYRGPGDPADQDLVFSLQTEPAAAAAAAVGLPLPLPEGTMLGGLAAALLARAELQQLPATLVAGVQVQQVPDAQFLYALGQALAAALRSTAAEAAEAALVQQGRGAALAALGAAADAVYRSSASSSIFS